MEFKETLLFSLFGGRFHLQVLRLKLIVVDLFFERKILSPCIRRYPSPGDLIFKIWRCLVDDEGLVRALFGSITSTLIKWFLHIVNLIPITVIP